MTGGSIQTENSSPSFSTLHSDESMNNSYTDLQESAVLRNSRSLGLYIIGTLIVITAITGNAFVVAVYLKSTKLKESTGKFILNLAVADCLSGFVGMVSVFLSATGILQSSWLWCLLPLQSMAYLSQVSEVLVLVTTFERYIAICQRPHYIKIMTNKRVYILQFLSWCFPLPLAMMPFCGLNNWSTTEVCQYPSLLPSWMHIVNSTMIFIFIVITAVMYTKILLKAREFYKRPQPVNIQCINPQITKSQGTKSSIKNGKVIGFVTLAFIVCWVPYHAFVFSIALGNLKYNLILSNIFYLLGILNSCINPFIYAYQKRDFRSQVRTLFRCRIQAVENRFRNSAVSINRDEIPPKEGGVRKEVHKMFLVKETSRLEDFATTSNMKTSTALETTSNKTVVTDYV